MGRINVLDFSVANLIAAGEVVERPASVVKELLENSIDSGADLVTVEIQHGGVTFIRVADNGCGMTKDDLPIAIKRHATSKIRNAGDLDSIKTLGFRGEALAAISSVSEMRIISRTKDCDTGTVLTAVGGEVTDISECGAAPGTTVIVENLFGTVPARRKFLKKDVTEAMAVSAVVEKIALSHSETAFKLIIDGAVKFATSGDGKLKNTVYAVLGRDFASKLLDAYAENSGAKVTGYVGRPDNARANRNFENTFINGRYIRSKTVSAALEQAYSSYIPADKFPSSVIFIEVPPQTVDVNVHPAKLEVKFSNEKAVFEAVYYATRSALENSITRPELELHDTGVKEMKSAQTLHAFAPMGTSAGSAKAQIPIAATALFSEIKNMGNAGGEREKTVYPEKPQRTAEKPIYASPMPEPPLPEPPPVTEDIPLPSPPPAYCAENRFVSDVSEKVTEIPTDNENSSVAKPVADEPVPAEKTEYRIAGVLFNCYILAEHDGIVTVIDKHAAHERIIFEELKKNLKAAERETQLLIFPVEVRLSHGEYAALEENRKAIADTGFTLEFKSECRIDVCEIPVSIEPSQVEDMIVTMAERLSEGTGGLDVREEVYEKALYQASCKAAVKAGRYDEPETVEWICERVMSDPAIRFCPHGRPVSLDMKKSDFDRQFRRT